jgi:hypothetical protein
MYVQIVKFCQISALKLIQETTNFIVYCLNWKQDQIYNSSQNRAAFAKGIYMSFYMSFNTVVKWS